MTTETERVHKARSRCLMNDPPIRVNQRWIALDSKGMVARRLRILASYPDEDQRSATKRRWIVQDEPAGMRLSNELRVTEELNLRYVFSLEKQ